MRQDLYLHVDLCIRNHFWRGNCSSDCRNGQRLKEQGRSELTNGSEVHVNEHILGSIEWPI